MGPPGSASLVKPFGAGVPEGGAAGPSGALVTWTVSMLATAMAAALLFFVYRYGDDVPYFDDWEIVPALTGHEPITLGWLWSQHNEHRMPLTRLILLGLYRASGDFRAAMFFDAAALILMTWIMLLVAFRLRSRLAVTDLFIPLLLLSWGHYNNLLWSWQVGFVAPTLFAVLAISLIASNEVPTLSAAWGMSVLVCALPLTTAVGPAYAAPLSAWMLLAAMIMHRGTSGIAFPLWLGGALGLALTALYFVGYQASTIPHSAGLEGWFHATLNFLSMAMGPLGGLGSENLGMPGSSNLVWPPTGTGPRQFCGIPVRELWGYAAGTALFVGLIQNTTLAVRSRRDLIRRSGMALAIIGSLIVALAVGWGRRKGLWARYAVLGVPGLLTVYISTLLLPSCRLGWFLRGALFSLALIAAWPNQIEGWLGGQWRHEKTVHLEQELRAGVPPLVLADHYTRPPNALCWRLHEDEVAADIRMLAHAGTSLFRYAHDDPVYETLDVAAEKVAGGKMVYVLKDPRHVYAIRLDYQYHLPSSTAVWALFRASWSGMEAQPHDYANPLLADGRPDHLYIWVNEPVRQFSISPDDGACHCQVNKVQLLVRP